MVMSSSSGGSGLHQLQNLSASIEVRTLPQGLPEPPVDVQVEAAAGGGGAAAAAGDLLVSWLPVTINPSGTSNGAPVVGYDVLADGVRVARVESGTADQAVVRRPEKFTR